MSENNESQADRKERLRKTLEENRAKRGAKKYSKSTYFITGAIVFVITIAVLAHIGANTPPTVTPQAATSQTDQSQSASAAPASSAPTTTIPAAEQNFVNILSDATGTYAGANNDMTKGALRHKRAQDLCAAFPSGKIDRWAGTIATLDSTDKGNGILTISLNSNVTLGTNNNEFSDSIGPATLIPVNSSLFNKVSQMKVGDAVYFSGNFLSSDTDCFQESSLTTDGSMQNPQFLIQFKDVSEATGP